MKEICPLIDCTGCQACRQICPRSAIQMLENEKGHIYPSIDQSLCIDCGLCLKHCPSLNSIEKREPQRVIAGWINDFKIRMSSTSGGISYALSRMIVSEGGYFCGVVWDNGKRGTRHEITNDINRLSDFQGSKYSHSETFDVFQRIKMLLQRNDTVLFAGTPCQVAGLKSFLQKNYENLYTVDLICHGVPSRKILRERIEYMEQNSGKRLLSLASREKTPNQYSTSTKYFFDDGSSTYVSNDKDPMFRCFVENFCLRPNCFRCQYAQKSRCSDFTIGDFWGYEAHSLRFRSYRKGTSAILINTEKGARLFQSIEHELIWEERNFHEVSSCNRNLTKPQMKPEKYDEFWKRYSSGEQLQNLTLEYFPPQDRKISYSHELKIFIKMLLPSSLLEQLKKYYYVYKFR